MALDILCSKLHATMLTKSVFFLLYWRVGKEDHRQRWYHHRQGVGPALVRHRGSLYRPQVPVATAPVGPGITVEHFAPHAPAWGAHPIVRTRYRREVAHHQQRRLGSLPLA